MKRLLILSVFSLILFTGCAGSAGNTPSEITASAVRQKLNDPNVTIIDVREESEYTEQHISNAVLMPLSSLQNIKNTDIKPDSEIIVYCRTGRRSLQALNTLKQLGYTNVQSMSGGIMAWVAGENKVCKNTEKTC